MLYTDGYCQELESCLDGMVYGTDLCRIDCQKMAITAVHMVLSIMMSTVILNPKNRNANKFGWVLIKTSPNSGELVRQQC
jgi:hypothetical protein